jgi:hypothetical protein
MNLLGYLPLSLESSEEVDETTIETPFKIIKYVFQNDGRVIEAEIDKISSIFEPVVFGSNRSTSKNIQERWMRCHKICCTSARS